MRLLSVEEMFDENGVKVGVMGRALLLSSIPGIPDERDEAGNLTTTVDFSVKSWSGLYKMSRSKKNGNEWTNNSDEFHKVEYITKKFNIHPLSIQELENSRKPTRIQPQDEFILGAVDVMEDGSLRGSAVIVLHEKNAILMDVSVRPVRKPNGYTHSVDIAFPMQAVSTKGISDYLTQVESVMLSMQGNPNPMLRAWGFSVVARNAADGKANGPDISHTFLRHLDRPWNPEIGEVGPPLDAMTEVKADLNSGKGALIRAVLESGGTVEVIPMRSMRISPRLQDSWSVEGSYWKDAFHLVRATSLKKAATDAVVSSVNLNDYAVAAFKEEGFQTGTVITTTSKEDIGMGPQDITHVSGFAPSGTSSEPVRRISELLTPVMSDADLARVQGDMKEAKMWAWVLKSAQACSATNVNLNDDGKLTSLNNSMSPLSFPLSTVYKEWDSLKALESNNIAAPGI